MIVIAPRTSYMVEECLERAPEVAPFAWAHRRQMLWMSKLNAIDHETWVTMKKSRHPFTRNARWIGSFSLTEATLINYHYPEVFNDRTGRAMRKFLARNPQYRVEKA